MSAGDGGAEADHVEAGLLVAEQAAFQACVNGDDLGILLQQLVERALGDPEHGGSHVWVPARIRILPLNATTCKPRHRFEPVTRRFERLGNVRPGASQKRRRVPRLGQADDRYVVRRLDEILHCRAHLDDSVWKREHRVVQLRGRQGCEHLEVVGGGIGVEQLELHLGLQQTVLRLSGRLGVLECGKDGVNLAFRDADGSDGLATDGVVLVSRIELRESHLGHSAHNLLQAGARHHDRISAPLVDVHSAVAAN
mmetsp:Transcript_19162/g.72382  ORF Transcript_19162/g.72382 Transcript_19162/m.72382 type:complete len:253 (+) Transcript_19162:348-1106(+)